MDCVRSLRDVAGTRAVEALRSGCSRYVDFLTTTVCCYSTETNEDGEAAENGVELAALLPETPQRNGSRDEDSKRNADGSSASSTAAEENNRPRPSPTEEALRRLGERPARRRLALARGDAGDEERAGAEARGVPTDDGQPLALFAPGNRGT